MHPPTRLTSTFISTFIALALMAVPAAAFAQSAPSDTPSYAAPAPSYGSTDETIQGRIASFDGAYSLQVRDDRGYIDNVALQQGTVINPTGIRLSPGMAVTIHGVNRGHTFAALVIDTPYSSYGPVAVYPYGYPAYGYPVYPYPLYGYGYGYPYSRISIGFGFGFGGGRRWR
jgi:hypothetical protein